MHLNDQITEVWSKWLNQRVNPTHQMTRDTMQGEGEAGDERADRVWLFLHLFLGNLLKMIHAWVGIKVNQRLSPHHHVMRVNRIISNFLLLLKDGIPYNIAIQQHVCSNTYATTRMQQHPYYLPTP